VGAIRNKFPNLEGESPSTLLSDTDQINPKITARIDTDVVQYTLNRPTEYQAFLYIKCIKWIVLLATWYKHYRYNMNDSTHSRNMPILVRRG